MPSNAKFCKKNEMQIKKMKREAELLKIRKEFLEMEGYRIEVAENSFILFENEEDYLNIFYLEKVIFDFINNLLYNEDKDKEIRIYFRLSLIEKYLKSLPKFRKIKIFYDDTNYENPFKIKFPFICCFEDLDKRCKYLDEIVDLHRRNNDGINENDCQLYEGKCLDKKFFNIINLLYNRIDIEYYKRKQNKFECYNTEKFHHRFFYPNLIMFYNSDTDIDSDSDKDIDSDSDKDKDSDLDTDSDSDSDSDSDKDKIR